MGERRMFARCILPKAAGAAIPRFRSGGSEVITSQVYNFVIVSKLKLEFKLLKKIYALFYGKVILFLLILTYHSVYGGNHDRQF